MRSPKNEWQRQPRRRGFDDDNFYGNTPAPPVFPTFAGSSSGAPEMKAVVKWFNGEKGFGFVELADGSGDIFLHINALQSSGYQTVNPGATLMVRVGQGQKGRQVEQVMSVDESTAAAPRPRGPADPSRPRTGPSGPRRQVDLSSAVEMIGTVKWYNPDKGFGFVTPQDGGKDVFVHATALERAGMASLHEGQSVRMHVVQGGKGPEAGAIQTA